MATTYVFPQFSLFSTLIHARKFISKVLKISSSCWTPKIRSWTLDHLVEILKESAFEKCEGSEPEPGERAVTVLKSTQLLCLADSGIKVFEIIYWNQQRAATTGEELWGCVLTMRKFWKGRRCLLISELDFFNSHSGTGAAPPLLLYTKPDDPANPHTVKRKCLLLKYLFVFYLISFVNCS